MNTKAILFSALLAVVAASGCRDRVADAAAAAAAQAAATEQAANDAGAAFDAAAAEDNWALAKAQGDVLLARYPDSDVAKRIQPEYDEIKAKVDAEREALRVAALWSYNSEAVKGGKQLSASVYSKDEVDVGDGKPQSVRLIFRDHPSWGKSSYLVIKSGDFNCYGGCKVKVKVDDAAPKSMAALRPKTDEAIAMFINDERALWRMTKGAKLIAIEFPVKAGGTRTAEFEVAGLDRSKMPAW